MASGDRRIICAVVPGTDLESAPDPLRTLIKTHTYIELKNKRDFRRIAFAIGVPLVKREKIVEIDEP